MAKLNLPTLAANAARARQRLARQEIRLAKLTKQIIERVGTGGQTIQTSLGSVIVTAETYDRNGDGFIYVFDADAFQLLSPKLQGELAQAGVVRAQKKVIRGQSPKVQFRLNGDA